MPSGLEAVDRIVRGFLSMVVESLNVDRDSLRHITHHIVNVFLQLTPHFGYVSFFSIVPLGFFR